MDEQVVVIVGGTSGIGFEIAHQGWRVRDAIIAGRNPDKLAQAAERLSGTVMTPVLDAHDETRSGPFLGRPDNHAARS